MAFNPNIPGYSTQGKSFARTAAFPLESYEIWTDYDALVAYAANTDPAKDPSYIGQKVAYIDTENNRVVHYGIEIDGTLKELGADKMGVEALTAADEGRIPQAFWVVDTEASGEEGAEDYQPEVGHVEIRWIEAALTDTVTTVGSADGSVTVTKNGDHYDLSVPAVEIPEVEIPEIEIVKDTEAEVPTGATVEVLKHISAEEHTITEESVQVVTKKGLDDAVEALEKAIDEIPEQTDYIVTVTTENVEDTNFKHYVFTQCGNEIAHIDIPKDLVVESGKVEVKAEAGAWGEAGTYIVLTIANQEAPIYINAKDLVDIYDVDNTSTIAMSIDNSNKITADVKISAEAGNSLVAKTDGLYVNAPKLPDSADEVVAKQYVTAVDQKDGKITVSRKQISYNELADLPTIPGSDDFGVLAITGKDAIDVTGDQEKEIALLIDSANKGNVVLTQSTAGLKAEVDLSEYAKTANLPAIEIANAIAKTPAPETATISVIASLTPSDHTITPTTVEVVTKKAWDTLDETGERLISQSEIDKLAKLNLDNGEITISGSVNASQVKELYNTVVNIVKGVSAGDLDPDTEGDQLGLGIEKGAQVNKIEAIALPDAVLAITDKQVNIPAATNSAYGVIKLSTDFAATTTTLGLVKSVDDTVKNGVQVAADGTMGVAKVSTDTLVQGELELVLNGGNAALSRE